MANTPIEYSLDTPFAKRIAALVKKLAGAHHETLKDARFAIVSATRQPEDKPVRIVSPGPYARACEIDLVLVFDDELQSAKENVVRAWVDNAMADWQGTEKKGKDGESARRVFQRTSSIPVHPDVIQRNGPVLENWRSVATAVQQMALPLESTEKAA